MRLLRNSMIEAQTTGAVRQVRPKTASIHHPPWERSGSEVESAKGCTSAARKPGFSTWTTSRLASITSWATRTSVSQTSRRSIQAAGFPAQFTATGVTPNLRLAYYLESSGLRAMAMVTGQCIFAMSALLFFENKSKCREHPMSERSASRFTHCQNNFSSYSSTCVKCFQTIGTRTRESELRADEERHSCMNPLPSVSGETTYWGILCRTCSDPVAFGTHSDHELGLGTENARPGTIRCAQGHNHIYFSRDFRFFVAEVEIAKATMRENRETYRSINPAPQSSLESWLGEPLISERKDESDVPPGGLREGEARPANVFPDPRRETARRAARDRWASWASKKTQ